LQNGFIMRRLLIIWLLLTFSGPIWLLVTKQVDLKADYTTANRDSANLAPNPKICKMQLFRFMQPARLTGVEPSPHIAGYL